VKLFFSLNSNLLIVVGLLANEFAGGNCQYDGSYLFWPGVVVVCVVIGCSKIIYSGSSADAVYPENLCEIDGE